MTNKTPTIEKFILISTLALMLEKGYENVDIKSVSRKVQLDLELIKQHYDTDDELRMSAMKYAAVIWVNHVRNNLEKIHDKEEKTYALIRHFIAGTERHSQSLSLYIDVWKKLRDLRAESRETLRCELLEIYNYYVIFFKDAIKNIFENISEYEAEQLAWIAVVLSDGFHIQSFMQSQQLDFDRITRIFCRMIEGCIDYRRE